MSLTVRFAILVRHGSDKFFYYFIQRNNERISNCNFRQRRMIMNNEKLDIKDILCVTGY